jgi:hypothetical protein
MRRHKVQPTASSYTCRQSTRRDHAELPPDADTEGPWTYRALLGTLTSRLHPRRERSVFNVFLRLAQKKYNMLEFFFVVSEPHNADLAGLPGVPGLPGARFPRTGDLACSGEPAISIADLDRYTDRWPEIYAATGRVPELEARCRQRYKEG